ncbi:glucosaminidase domain-containing protein [Marinobacter caseinilyticus]|uniref:glucosaminidase domain-containing protein n=1 Tax=Marinobacter caseinilyticus TaxID=2692195 RepID=UPI001409FF5D|nr:glucosaminidase domain-containing protein [Marinobacter caseinilyticus]
MAKGIRLLLFTLPLLAAAVWGTTYFPTSVDGTDSDDIELISLPPLPDWARKPLPDFSRYTDTTERKAAFFSYLYPRIVLANARVLIQRKHLLTLADKTPLSKQDRDWLGQQSERLKVEAPMGSEEMFDMLARRLDVIPPSLVLAQAANESAWGTSRFARSGNNLFGQWCFSKGCGLVPRGRVDGASHEVASFDSPYQSIYSYIQNLNRHRTYQPLRNTREQVREKGGRATGHTLAQGLIGYSERGVDYVEEIRSMIRFNNLSYYDRQYRKRVGDELHAPTLLDLSTAAEAFLSSSKTPPEG